MNEYLIPTNRYQSLDIFRGFIICLMIVVNTSGNNDSTFWLLKHADWNGFTLADLVFPSFLFAVGISLSFVSTRWKSMKESEVIQKIFKRTILIFIIGFLLYWFPFISFDNQLHLFFKPISQTRIMGVLQRIALCYGISALLFYYFGTRKTLFIGFFTLFVYWFLLLIFGENGNEFSKSGNAVLRFDLWILGAKHLYTGEGFLFDPEGLLSTIPALFNVIIGLTVGQFIQQKKSKKNSIHLFLSIGFIWVILAIGWNQILPINKKLWTSSYALLSVGLDCILLSCVIYLTENFGFRKGSHFFELAGKNSLLIYLISELGVSILFIINIGNESLFGWIYNHLFIIGNEQIRALSFSIWWMFTCWFLIYILDKQKINLKI